MHVRMWIGLVVLAIVTPTGRAAELAARQTLVHDGISRSYVLRLPEQNLKAGQRLPLVLVLHGGGGNADNAERMTGFTEKGRKEGFIVVYPEGTGRMKNMLLTWNAVHCCGSAMKNKVDDAGFIRALIDHLARRYPIDTKRIYATGMSNGGMMTHQLGIELADRLAAIAPVVATVFGDEKKPSHAVSALMINGALDRNVPPEGNMPGGRGAKAWDGTPTRPALSQSTFWAAANGCKPEPFQSETRAWTHWRYVCPSDRAVELYLVKDNGHAWPGGQPGSRRGDAPTAALDATDVIWDFFAAHSR
jgi:polyhydroxybutyrate depolymerase